MSKRTYKRPEREEVLELVEERGLRAAIQAAISVCEDKDAPAPARATAAGLLMRVGAIGGFGKNYMPPEPPGPLDHLSPDEYAAVQKRYLRKLEFEMAEHEAQLAAAVAGDDEADADEAGAFA